LGSNSKNPYILWQFPKKAIIKDLAQAKINGTSQAVDKRTEKLHYYMTKTRAMSKMLTGQRSHIL